MKKSIVTAALIVMICLCGCEQNKKGEEQTKPTVPPQGDSLFTELPGTEEVDLSGGEMSGIFEEPVPTDVAPEKIYEAKEYVALNRMKTGYLERDYVFCVDETTGNVYFVNMGKDYYIYRIKDGKAELAVKLPAKELCMWKGTLYFMLESYGKYDLAGGREGDIYAYSPADGTVEMIYEAGTILGEFGQWLCCDETGLYFSAGTTEMLNGYSVLREKFYHLPYGELEPMEDNNKSTYSGWGEFYLVYAVTSEGKKYRLDHRSGGAENTIDLGVEGISKCHIIGDKLYYSTGLTVGIKDMVTGETEVFDFSAVIGESGNLKDWKELLHGLNSFTLTEDYVWASGGNYLLKHHIPSGEVTGYDVDGTIEVLYTTGDEVYARLLSEEIVRIKTEQATEAVYPLVPQIGMETLVN